MSNLRFEVFVSSTFRDLQQERQAVLEAILEMGNIPAGMEIFPASATTPWELIESIIEGIDYYVLIIGGKYGSISEEGISYTEKEFEAALRHGVPILAFLHKEPGTLPLNNSETDEEARVKLEDFRGKVERSCHCKYWDSAEQLRAQVIVGLNFAIKTNPRPGWLRGDGVNNQELLLQVAELSSRVEKLRAQNAELEKDRSRFGVEDIAGLEDTYEMTFSEGRAPSDLKLKVSWSEIFFFLAEDLLHGLSEREVASGLWAFVSGLHDFDAQMSNGHVSRECVEQISVQLLGLDLIEPVTVGRNKTRRSGGKTTQIPYKARGWQLTPKGKSLLVSKRVIRKPRAEQ